MKKLFVALLFVVFCFVPLVVMAEHSAIIRAHAMVKHSAIDKGSIEFGIANVAEFNLYRGPNIISGDTLGIGQTPDFTIGYFIFNRLSLGLTFGFFDTEVDSDINISPFIKYYLPISDRFLINAKGFFGHYRYTDDTDPDNPFTRSRYGGGIAGTFMLLPQLGSSIEAGFTRYCDYKIGGIDVWDTAFFSIDFIFGLTAYLR